MLCRDKSTEGRVSILIYVNAYITSQGGVTEVGNRAALVTFWVKISHIYIYQMEAPSELFLLPKESL